MEPALVDGAPGVVAAAHGRLVLALIVKVREGRITRYEVVADPHRLRRLELRCLPPVRERQTLRVRRGWCVTVFTVCPADCVRTCPR